MTLSVALTEKYPGNILLSCHFAADTAPVAFPEVCMSLMYNLSSTSVHSLQKERGMIAQMALADCDPCRRTFCCQAV